MNNLKIDEARGMFKTANKTGYMVGSIDSYTQQFIDFTDQAPGPSLDIGSSYGIITLEVLKKGNKIYANDISIEHLKYLDNQVPLRQKKYLECLCKNFPDELEFPEHYLGAVLASRVFHFLNPAQIRTGLTKVYQWLKTGGKIFITSETPYRSDVQEFISVYEKRKEKGSLWPGIITDVKKYMPTEAYNLPSFLNFWDADIAERELKEAGFSSVEVFSFKRDLDASYTLEGKDNFFMAIGTK